ncbi:MAG: hypothetical protein ACYSVY_00145 [Planctomycetota bacterium]
MAIDEGKVRCDCNRWLARVEDGGLYIRCSRCGEDHRIELTELMVELEGWLRSIKLEVWREAGKPPRAFG